MKLVVTYKSYMNKYENLMVPKATTILNFSSWLDANKWIGNYVDCHDQIRRESIGQGERYDVKARTYRRDLFEYDTIIIIRHDRGIDSVYIRMVL